MHLWEVSGPPPWVGLEQKTPVKWGSGPHGSGGGLPFALHALFTSNLWAPKLTQYHSQNKNKRWMICENFPELGKWELIPWCAPVNARFKYFS